MVRRPFANSDAQRLVLSICVRPFLNAVSVGCQGRCICRRSDDRKESPRLVSRANVIGHAPGRPDPQVKEMPPLPGHVVTATFRNAVRVQIDASMVASPADVDNFLSSRDFSSYQSVPLPHGRRTPGKDFDSAAKALLASHVEGRSVLDVGTYYGLFAYQAIRLGAFRVVGVEPDPERLAIARQISELHGRKYEIVSGDVDHLPSEEFDVVLLLNVLHHLVDPVGSMRQLARVSKEKVIVEFPPVDRFFLRRYTRSRLEAIILARIVQPLPLAGIRGERYSTFYFSPKAFRNLFVTHLGLFSNVTFQPSPRSSRIVAVCLL
jgi:2-polyprenyl-3-methyl-5-hydroxy-6-metoxy-1,4-benzoquinol methylase